MRLLVIKLFFVISFAFFPGELKAQEYLYETFYETRIVNGHSVEVNNLGVMKFIIAHRFGPLNGGLYEFWGLDASTIRIGLDYGLANWLTLGFGRSSFEKTYDFYSKARLMRQGGPKNNPVSVALFNSIAIRTEDFESLSGIEYLLEHKLSYTIQALIARKMNERISLQIMPSFVHRNYVRTGSEFNDVFSIGFAGRSKLSKNVTSSIEYYYLPGSFEVEGFHENLAIGFDINTKGHVFSLHFGNSLGMIEKFFITETTGSWKDGDVRFGFNITRDFKVKGRKY